VRIYTSRYQNKALAEVDAVKVGISVGGPRFRIDYRVVRLSDLAPRFPMLKLRGEEFRREYRAYLHRLTTPRIVQLLEQLSHDNGDSDLVLLCFEDVNAGMLCHRRYLAEFLRAEAGLEIPELPTAPSETKPEQTSNLSLPIAVLAGTGSMMASGADGRYPREPCGLI